MNVSTIVFLTADDARDFSHYLSVGMPLRKDGEPDFDTVVRSWINAGFGKDEAHQLAAHGSYVKGRKVVVGNCPHETQENALAIMGFSPERIAATISNGRDASA